MLRDTLGDTHDQANLCLDRLFDTSSSKWRRNEDRARVCFGLLDGIAHARKDRLAQVLGACFFGVRPADNICTVFDCLLCVEGALSAREALKDDFRVSYARC